jgi:hypothetical protein
MKRRKNATGWRVENKSDEVTETTRKPNEAAAEESRFARRALKTRPLQRRAPSDRESFAMM